MRRGWTRPGGCKAFVQGALLVLAAFGSGCLLAPQVDVAVAAPPAGLRLEYAIHEANGTQAHLLTLDSLGRGRVLGPDWRVHEAHLFQATVGDGSDSRTRRYAVDAQSGTTLFSGVLCATTSGGACDPDSVSVGAGESGLPLLWGVSLLWNDRWKTGSTQFFEAGDDAAQASLKMTIFATEEEGRRLVEATMTPARSFPNLPSAAGLPSARLVVDPALGAPLRVDLEAAPGMLRTIVLTGTSTHSRTTATVDLPPEPPLPRDEPWNGIAPPGFLQAYPEAPLTASEALEAAAQNETFRTWIDDYPNGKANRFHVRLFAASEAVGVVDAQALHHVEHRATLELAANPARLVGNVTKATQERAAVGSPPPEYRASFEELRSPMPHLPFDRPVAHVPAAIEALCQIGIFCDLPRSFALVVEPADEQKWYASQAAVYFQINWPNESDADFRVERYAVVDLSRSQLTSVHTNATTASLFLGSLSDPQ